MSMMSYNKRDDGYVVSDNSFTVAVKTELSRAREKFPSNNLGMIALVEEVGELAQALLKWKAGKFGFDRVFDEAVQVATMAQRVAVESDASFKGVDYVEPE